jgi:ATP adenylyltransferase/5',5'''-P-1,P-4-tetraphosphate phosphorylase II
MIHMQDKHLKMEFSKKARELIHEQAGDWDLAKKNYASLKKIRVKTFYFENYHIDIQFNPERIVSSSAKVDAQSIEARPCFLCQKNLPVQQRSLAFEDDYLVLVNPFPIFPEHLTIPARCHSDQLIAENFGSMLDLAAGLSDFVIFYNGPKCGASAPDHLHFQAGIKGFLPIEKDFINRKCCIDVRRLSGIEFFHWPDYQRGIITLKGKNKAGLMECFSNIYSELAKFQHNEAEPMLNILATFDNEEWIIHVIPRTLHRPSHYFETGLRQILLSPASVDMGGVMITPREEDFIKITAMDVTAIFGQVTLPSATILQLINQL